MDVKISPRATKQVENPTKKRTGKRKKDAQATGVVAARAEYASTNVSSPIRATTRKRRGPATVEDLDDEGMSVLHPNGYYRDTFVVSDGGEEETASDSDGFEPVRAGPSRLRRTVQRKLGTPITSDVTMESLSPQLQTVVEDFVVNAKNRCNEIQLEKSLRAVPFTDTVLREMAIRFTTSEEKMLTIPGINPDMVRLHGRFFMDLAGKSKELYDTMPRSRLASLSGGYRDSSPLPRATHTPDDGPAIDPNHENVIDLVSSDDDDDDQYGSDALFDADEDDSEEQQGEDEFINSSYFSARPPAPDVAAFTEQVKVYQNIAPPQPQPSFRPRAGSSGRGGGGSNGARPHPRKKNRRSDGGRRSSDGFGHGRFAKSRSGAPARGGSKATGGRSGRGGDSGGAAIGMMPT